MDDTLTTQPARLRQDRRRRSTCIDSRDRDTGALIALDLKTGEQEADRRGRPGRRRRRSCRIRPRRRSRRSLHLRPHASGRSSTRRSKTDFDYLDTVADGELQRRQPHARRQAVDRRLPAGRRPGAVTTATTATAKKATFLFTNRKDARRPAAGEDAPGGHQVARRPEAGQLSDAAAGQRSGRRRQARQAAADGAATSTAARGPATAGASTPSTSGWPTAATPC